MLKIQNGLNEIANDCLIGSLVIADVDELKSDEALGKAKCLFEENIREMQGHDEKEILRHTNDIESYVRIFSRDAETLIKKVYK